MKQFTPATCLWPFPKIRRCCAGQTVTVAILLSGLEGIAPAAVQVTPQRIEESRVLVFKDDKVSRTPASLKLTLALEGPEAESATQYGHVKLDEATDSTGTSLISRQDSLHNPSKFRDYANAFFRNSKFRQKTEIVPPQVELELAVPARAATKIVSLRGSLDLSDGGKTNTVELGGLKRAEKRVVPLPNGSPVEVTIVVPSEDTIRSVNLQCTGDDSALSSVEVVDGTGKRISTGISSWSLNGGPAQKSLNLTKALDDSMKLVVKVISDRKFTKVTFDLKDIPLP